MRGEPIFGLKNREPEPGRTGTGRKGGRDHQMTVSCDPDVASETSHDTKRKSDWWGKTLGTIILGKAWSIKKDIIDHVRWLKNISLRNSNSP